MGRSRDAEAELNLPPGFRFHPTDEELVLHYLCRKAAGQRLPVPIIAEIDLYKYEPWQLPEKAWFGQREWYFFTPRDRKYPNGSRPNRAAGSGYWKATGADKPVSAPGRVKPLGIKKALVFYHGKAPKGIKTDWIMHEYRLADTDRAPNKKGTLRLDDWVLCRLYNKKNAWEKMQRSSKEEQESSYGETMTTTDSFDAASESFQTPESGIEHGGGFQEFDDFLQPRTEAVQGQGGQANGNGNASNLQMIERMKEESDWFMDLNLDDLQTTPFDQIGLAPSMMDQDFYFSSAGFPFLKPTF